MSTKIPLWKRCFKRIALYLCSEHGFSGSVNKAGLSPSLSSGRGSGGEVSSARFHDYVFGGVLLLILLAGCGTLVPAETPAQLKHTPGAPVTLTEMVYESQHFRLRYPVGWQVITGAANAPTWVVFVSPDEQALMAVSLEQLDPAPQPPNQTVGALRTEAEQIMLEDGQQLYTRLVAPEADWGRRAALYEQMVASLRPPV